MVNWLSALRNADAPYIPGVMLAWTVIVGNDNTRWHWGSKLGTPEPAIPWCGLHWPAQPDPRPPWSWNHPRWFWLFRALVLTPVPLGSAGRTTEARNSQNPVFLFAPRSVLATTLNAAGQYIPGHAIAAARALTSSLKPWQGERGLQSACPKRQERF